MALTAALQAWAWSGISRAEASLRARQANNFYVVFLRVLEHALVVRTPQDVVAGVALVCARFVLALDASIGVGIEGSTSF